jgi:phosphomannomutase
MIKNKFIFDVDDTLTPSRAAMDTAFKNWFLNFCTVNDVYLVTGSDYAKTREQLGDDVCYAVAKVYSCSGNEVWSKGVKISHNSWSAPSAVYDILNSWLMASKFVLRTGKHIEERSGTINFSIVGRNATLGERKLYKKWDTVNRERESIAFQINSTFEDITATIGGETGIDIYPTGKDKGQILADFKGVTDKIYFFGDKTDQGGNDYPLACKLKNWYKVASWKATWELLLYLQEARVAD